MPVSKLFLSLGAFNAGLAVLAGAFGAHGLKARFTTEIMQAYQTGVQYHFYHSLGLILAGILLMIVPASPLVKAAGWCMLAGIIFFSGSLYFLTMFDLKWLGPVTPLGGIFFIIAWGLFFTGIIRLSYP